MSNSNRAKEYSAKNETLGNVGDVLAFIGHRPLPVVRESASIEEIVNCFTQSTYSRVIYVVDENGALAGAVTQEELVKHLFIHYHDEYLDKRSLLSQAVSETAADLMHNERLHCTANDELAALLTDMISFHQDEVPVVDSTNRIINDITMMDIIRYCASSGIVPV